MKALFKIPEEIPAPGWIPYSLDGFECAVNADMEFVNKVEDPFGNSYWQPRDPPIADGMLDDINILQAIVERCLQVQENLRNP